MARQDEQKRARETHSKASDFGALHPRDGIIRLPNAFDAASAGLLAASRFVVIDTTSWEPPWLRCTPTVGLSAKTHSLDDRADYVCTGVTTDIEPGKRQPQRMRRSARAAIEIGAMGRSCMPFTQSRQLSEPWTLSV